MDSAGATPTGDVFAEQPADTTQRDSISATTETRTLGDMRTLGTGALVVLALLGGFGLRQLVRARAPE